MNVIALHLLVPADDNIHMYIQIQLMVPSLVDK